MLAVGRVRNCVWCGLDGGARVAFVEIEPVVYREEAVGLLFAVADILTEVRAIRRHLEADDDGEEEEGFSE